MTAMTVVTVGCRRFRPPRLLIGNGTYESGIPKLLRHLGEAHLGMQRELVQESGKNVISSPR
jgi:hypothetical protein